MLKVKAGKISNLTDARYFAAMDVEWMGFNLDQGSGNALSIPYFKEISEWVEGPKIIAEMGFCDVETASEVIANLNIHAIQVGQFGELPPDPAVHVLREIVVEPSDNAAMLSLKIETARQRKDEHFLLNFHQNKIAWENLGVTVPITVENLRTLSERFPVILSIGFLPDSVHQILNAIEPLGIELLGSAEEKPGYKSYDDLDPIFEAIASLG